MASVDVKIKYASSSREISVCVLVFA